MNVTEDGVPVPDLIAAVKRVIKTANVSATDQGRDLQVGSVSLILHAIATRSSGGGLNFYIPFIGMEVQFGPSSPCATPMRSRSTSPRPGRKAGRRYATAVSTTFSWNVLAG